MQNITYSSPQRSAQASPSPRAPTTTTRPAPMTDATPRAVPDKERWNGDGTEKIKVELIDTVGIESFSTGTYTVNNPQGSTEVLPGDQAILWPHSDRNYTVYAWYPVRDEYDISGQSTPTKFRQADVLGAREVFVSINASPDIKFRHRMAKVRVVLTGVNASATDIEVGILGATRFTVSRGYISKPIGQPDYITACRDPDELNVVAFEALVSPEDTIVKDKYLRIAVGGRTYYFSPGPAGHDTYAESYTYTYRVAIPSATATTAAPGAYLFRVYNTPEHITLSGSTASVAEVPGKTDGTVETPPEAGFNATITNWETVTGDGPVVAD